MYFVVNTLLYVVVNDDRRLWKSGDFGARDPELAFLLGGEYEASTSLFVLLSQHRRFEWKALILD